MNPDVMIVVAAKNLVTSHTGWANHTGASNRLAWTGPASEVDGAVWEKLMELLSAVKHPKLAFAGAQGEALLFVFSSFCADMFFNNCEDLGFANYRPPCMSVYLCRSRLFLQCVR